MRNSLIGSFLGFLGAVAVLAACGGGGPSASITEGDVEARLAAVEGDVIQLQAGLATQAATIAALEAALAAQTEGFAEHVIGSNTTLEVPADFPDIHAALASLDDKIIAPGVVVTVQVAAGTYVHESPIHVAHRDGDKIHIVGDPSDPTAVELHFSGHGLVVAHGAALGGFDGFTLIGDDGEFDHGVSAEAGAVVNCGPNLEARDFGMGFCASKGATLHAEGTTASSSSQHGYYAFGGGILYVNDSHSTSSGVNGYRAENGSAIHADGLTASGNGEMPLYAIGRSLIVGESASVTVASGETGVEARDLSYISVSGGTVSGGSVGIRCQFGSMVNATSATVSGTVAAANPSFNTLSTDGSYISN